MANLGLQKPKKSQIINAVATSVGATAGYQGYEMVAQKLPITKEMNLGILGGSVLGLATLKGTGIAKTIASAILVGITVNAGFTALEDYGVLDKLYPSQTANLQVGTQVIEATNVEELNGIYGFDNVEYIQPETIDVDFDLM